jgi:predicted nuclease with TOPRIM domain
MLKHIREILKEVIEIFDNTTKEHESILSELEEKDNTETSNAESYKDISNDKAKSLEDSNYFTEPSHYNPYRNNK